MSMDKQWIEDGSLLISPDAKFRQELARSLRDTHQRQQVQRSLHTGKAPRRTLPALGVLLTASALLALLIALGYALRRRLQR